MSQILRPRRTMLFIGTVITLLLLLLGVFAFKTPGNVHAEGSTLFVGLTPGSNTGCASPGFPSVQAAVDAANIGNTVYLCGANSYVGQVIITKAITLTGDSGASIQAPSTPFPLSPLPSQFTTDHLFIPQAIVTVWGTSSNATITHLTIAAGLPGMPGMPGNGSCAGQ